MMMASQSRSRSKSVVASNRPLAAAFFTRSGPMCLMYDSPRPSAATLTGSTSRPVTWKPASQKTSASGSPT